MNMKRLFCFLSVVLLGVIVTGSCSCQHKISGIDELDGTHWKLQTINGSNLIENYYASMYFRPEQIMGDDGINTYAGYYILEAPNNLVISNCAFTLMGSTAERNEQEQRFTKAFGNVVNYHLEGNKLILSDVSGQPSLVFLKLPKSTENATQLINTKWRPVTVRGEPCNQISNAILIFHSDGIAIATDGLYTSEYTYQVIGDDLWWEGEMGWRTTLDNVPTNPDAGKFLASLNEVSNYRLVNGQLELYTMWQEQVAVILVPVDE